MSAVLWGATRVKFFVFLVVAAWLIGTAIGVALRPDSGGKAPQATFRQATETTVSALLAEHDCWTGDAPADMRGKVPGHVVVTLPDGTTDYGGRRLVGKALGQLFGGEEHGLAVKGFCR